MAEIISVVLNFAKDFGESASVSEGCFSREEYRGMTNALSRARFSSTSKFNSFLDFTNVTGIPFLSQFFLCVKALSVVPNSYISNDRSDSFWNKYKSAGSSKSVSNEEIIDLCLDITCNGFYCAMAYGFKNLSPKPHYFVHANKRKDIDLSFTKGALILREFIRELFKSQKQCPSWITDNSFDTEKEGDDVYIANDVAQVLKPIQPNVSFQVVGYMARDILRRMKECELDGACNFSVKRGAMEHFKKQIENDDGSVEMCIVSEPAYPDEFNALMRSAFHERSQITGSIQNVDAHEETEMNSYSRPYNAEDPNYSTTVYSTLLTRKSENTSDRFSREFLIREVVEEISSSFRNSVDLVENVVANQEIELNNPSKVAEQSGGETIIISEDFENAESEFSLQSLNTGHLGYESLFHHIGDYSSVTIFPKLGTMGIFGDCHDDRLEIQPFVVGPNGRRDSLDDVIDGNLFNQLSGRIHHKYSNKLVCGGQIYNPVNLRVDTSRQIRWSLDRAGTLPSALASLLSPSIFPSDNNWSILFERTKQKINTLYNFLHDTISDGSSVDNHSVRYEMTFMEKLSPGTPITFFWPYPVGDVYEDDDSRVVNAREDVARNNTDEMDADYVTDDLMKTRGNTTVLQLWKLQKDTTC